MPDWAARVSKSSANPLTPDTTTTHRMTVREYDVTLLSVARFLNAMFRPLESADQLNDRNVRFAAVTR
jgi:hypothetical protein